MKKGLIIFLTTLLIATGCGCENKESDNNTTKPNEIDKNSALFKEQEIGNVRVFGIDITKKEDSYSILVNIENITNKKVEISDFLINFKDSNDNNILENAISIPVNYTLNKDDLISVYYPLDSNFDFSKIANVEYSIK